MVRKGRLFIVGLTSMVALAAACKSSSDNTEGHDAGSEAPDSAVDIDAGGGGGEGDAAATHDAGTDAATDAALADAGESDASIDAGDHDAGTDAEAPSDAGADADPPAAMTLTSAAVAQGAFNAQYTCNGNQSLSPAVSWTAGPDGTASYAVVMKDLTVPNVHWAIYDLPPATLSLASGIPHGYTPGAPAPAGAKQATVTFSPGTHGYLGPCPPAQPKPEHEYVFTVYALKGATVSGVTSASTPEAVEAAIQAQKVAPGAEASLHASYKQP